MTGNEKPNAVKNLLCVLYCLWVCGARPGSCDPEPVGDFVSYSAEGSTVVFTCTGTHKVRLLICDPGIVRVEFDPRGTFELPNTYDGTEVEGFVNKSIGYIPGKVDLASHILSNHWAPVAMGHEDAGDHVKITTGELTVRAYKSPFRIHFYDEADTRLINKDHDAAGMTCNTGGSAPCELFIRKARMPEEHFFGFANDNRGYNDEFTCDYTGFYEGENPDGWYYRGYETYAAPFFYSTEGYGIFAVIDASNKVNKDVVTGHSYWDMGKSSTDRYSIRYWHDPGDLRFKQYLIYYFINGPDWPTIVDRYTDISGKPPLYEKKFFGVHAVNRCFVENFSAHCIEDQIRTYRENGFPLDVYVSEQLETYSGMDQWWGIKNNTPLPGYNWFPDPGTRYWNGAQNQTPQQLLEWVHEQGLKFGANITNGFDRPPDAHAAEYIVDHGFDVYWRDVMQRSRYHTDMKNTYTNFIKAFDNDTSRCFIRFGWASWVGQKYGAHHSGDRNMGNAVKARLAVTLGGYPYSQTDLGLERWRLPSYALMPIPFFHISGTQQETQPWKHNQRTQDAYRHWMRFHQRMVPYLFTYASRAHTDGMPVWRHMVFMDPGNPATYDKDYQAYVGDWLVVAPVRDEISASSEVYLPRGTWYDWYDGTVHRGEKTFTADAGPDRLPLFAREGAIIPMAPAMNYIGEIPEDPLTLRIWPSANPSQFKLREDATGITSTFGCLRRNTQVDISIPPFGGSRWSPATRNYVLRVHTQGKTAVKVFRDNAATELTQLQTLEEFDAREQGWYMDPSDGGVCRVKPNGDNATGYNVYVSYNGELSARPVRDGTVNRIAITGAPHANTLYVTTPFHGLHHIELVTLNGRGVKRVRHTGPAPCAVSLEGVAGGMYFVRIRLNGTVVHRGRMLVGTGGR